MSTSTADNRQGTNPMADMFLYGSMITLLLHCYFFCYDSFHDWRLTWKISDGVLLNIANTGLFDNIWRSKLIALGLLLLFALVSTNRKMDRVSFGKVAWYLGAGICVYFISQTIFLFRIYQRLRLM
jgi:hypothetical protein